MPSPERPPLIVPVLNRYDLLAGMVASMDVDWPLVIIDNGGRLRRELPELAARVIDVGANLGVAASWNLGIRSRLRAPWWAFAGVDTVFGPGDLGRLAERMADPRPLCATLLEFGAFAVNAAAIEVVGFFDESYHPIYAEDCDWRWRAQLLRVPVVAMASSTRHAEGGSVTIREPGTDNGRTYPANVAYHRRKWAGNPWQETGLLAFGADDPSLVRMPRLSWLREQSWPDPADETTMLAPDPTDELR